MPRRRALQDPAPRHSRWLANFGDTTLGVRPLGLLIVAILFGGSCQTVGSAGAPGDVPGSGAEGPLGARSAGVSLPLPANRGLWVVRTTLVHPDSVRAMVRRAADAGFNTLLVQVRGRADSYFSGGIEPRAEALRQRSGFDPLALTLEEAHRRGLEVPTYWPRGTKHRVVRAKRAMRGYSIPSTTGAS